MRTVLSLTLRFSHSLPQTGGFLYRTTAETLFGFTSTARSLTPEWFSAHSMRIFVPSRRIDRAVDATSDVADQVIRINRSE